MSPTWYGRTPEQRFWTHVHKTDGCWLWDGALTDGYGMFRVDRTRTTMAHRFAYELLVDPIPAGLTLDHLCRVRHCVNPDHLEPVTRTENVMRGEGTGARFARRNRCSNGHLFQPETTYLLRGRWRMCRICKNDRARRRYHQRKAAA